MSSVVRLIVYDILGREIAHHGELVNEEKSPGKYEVQFTIGDLRLPSGIYFYKITAGTFSDTKKMMFVK